MGSQNTVNYVHSRAEIEWLLVVRFLHEKSLASVDDGLDILRRGDRCARSDGVVGGYVCEYDEAFYQKN